MSRHTEVAVRQAIVDAARTMHGLGINHGTSAHVSARWGDGLRIKPSGPPYGRARGVGGRRWATGTSAAIARRRRPG